MSMASTGAHCSGDSVACSCRRSKGGVTCKTDTINRMVQA